jgi:hypothetical protein
MAFYTNFYLRGSKLYLRGYDKGLPIAETVWLKPYLFAQSPKGDYKTIDGKTVGRVNFDSVRDARDFIEKYKNVDQFPIYGSANFGYVYINDKYRNDIEYDPGQVSVVTLDIECDSSDGFPDIRLADKVITAITLR